MTDLELFQELKDKVLQHYKGHFPFFTGSWKTFSSQDIQKLIILIETECKQSISEKWIYTHLKPEKSQKVPRKDMLDILSMLVGYSGWDELKFEYKDEETAKLPRKHNRYVVFVVGLVGLGVFFTFVIFFFIKKHTNNDKRVLQIKNLYNDQHVNGEEVKVYELQDSVKKAINIKNGAVEINDLKERNKKLEIVSPFYKKKVVQISQSDTALTEIDLEPNDYAMMLKAFMVSDIKDWQTRKIQLDKILSDDLEVIIMLKDDLGVEYFNKKEFSQKLIVPTASIKKMRIIELQSDERGMIQFIRINQ